MDLSLPWTALAGFGLLLLALSMATALASGRYALGRDVVRSVKDDW
jgi:putative ABC transport system permease protein